MTTTNDMKNLETMLSRAGVKLTDSLRDALAVEIAAAGVDLRVALATPGAEKAIAALVKKMTTSGRRVRN